MHRHGLSKRKTRAVLKDFFGLEVSPGGLVQAAHRAADKLKGRYEALWRQARAADHIHADETSWWVGRPGWWLWVFANPDLTLYRVARSRGREVVHQTLGAEFGGVLVSDCLSVYDDATPLQHKCYAHHLKAISKAIQEHASAGKGFLLEARSILKGAMALKSMKGELAPAVWSRMRRNIESNARALLKEPRPDPVEESVANRLRKQIDHLFVFLDHDGVEATNNLAERQLRPAVISRKLSCGNRTARGAQTWEVLTSLAVTWNRRGQSFRQLIAQTLRPP